jgi:hypothetical protein
MLSVDDLHKEDLLKIYKMQKVYDRIINRCYDDILQVHRYDRKNKMFFTVPLEIFEQPEYNFIDCVAYAIKEIRGGGFYVRYIRPNLLYISWNNPALSKNTKENFEMLKEEDNITKKTLGLLTNTQKLLTYHKGKEIVYPKN